MHWLITSRSYPSRFPGPSGLDRSKLPIGLSPIIPLLVRVVGQRLALLVHFTRRIVVFLMSTRSRLTSHRSLAPKTVEKQEGWDARWLSLKQVWQQTPWFVCSKESRKIEISASKVELAYGASKKWKGYPSVPWTLLPSPCPVCAQFGWKKCAMRGVRSLPYLLKWL